jgi:regulatory protein
MKSATEKSLEYLGRFSRTERQVRAYLSRKGYLSQDIDQAIAYLWEHHFLNDHAYAEAFIQSRIRRNDGPLKIRQMLFQKGVDPDTSRLLVQEQYPEDLQLEKACIALRTRLKKTKSTSRLNSPPLEERRKTTEATRFLASRGFSRYVIIQALKRVRNP